MFRQQTTKELAKRIEPKYVRQNSWRRWLIGISSLLLVGGALGWSLIGGKDRRNSLVNPGHVSAAHTMWENDCTVCHDGDGKGGIRKQVSDAACLRCHAATGGHHPNQLQRVGPNENNELALAFVAGGQMRSANCAACHIEHKGKATLSAVDNSTCTKCHANISAAANDPAKVKVANVTAFDDQGGHPYFGRELAGGKKAVPAMHGVINPVTLIDPTVLKFNHSQKAHLAIPPLPGQTDNCTKCHVNRTREPVDFSHLAETVASSATQAAGASTAPANRPVLSIRQTTGGDAEGIFRGEEGPGWGPIEPWAKGDNRYMRPISYARDCQSCHKLDPSGAGGALLPHVALDQAMPLIAPVQGEGPKLENFYRSWIARLSPGERKEALKGQTVDAWIAPQITALKGLLTAWVGGVKAGSLPGAKDLETELAGLSDEAKIDEDFVTKDGRVVSAFIAYGMGQSCAKCHTVSQSAGPKLAAATAPADAAKPSPVIPLLATVPTGIPQYPRRWFVHSRFDHQAHLFSMDEGSGNYVKMSCVFCHAGVKQSKLTSDVLSPNLTWKGEGGKMESCADCHHAPDKRGLAATADCVSCHIFHAQSVTTVSGH